MSIRIKIFLTIALLSHFPALAQVDTAWVRWQWHTGLARAIDVDQSGNVSVTGWSGTTQYSPQGESLWYSEYEGNALVIDDSGHVYVTASRWSNYSGYDYVTVKFAPSGDTIWVRNYDSGLRSYNDDEPTALTVDKDGNVYVTGYTRDRYSVYHYLTVKYSSTGDVLWARIYSVPEYTKGVAVALGVDNIGNVIVTGSSFSTVTGLDYVTIKYGPDGESLWVRVYNGPVNGDDEPGSIRFPNEDYNRTLAIDKNGNIYVTGSSYGVGTLQDYATIKYSPAGDTQWVRRYNGTADSNDYANAIAVDSKGNVFVTGVSRGVGNSSDDMVTIKYSKNGELLWIRRYDGPNGWDGGHDIVLDKNNNLYVTGYSRSWTLEDFMTIKYAPDGDILWMARYNSPANDNDVANAIALDQNENVYVTGRNSAIIGDAIVKYAQYSCVAKPGDTDADGQILISDIIYMINVLFKDGTDINPICRGDVNVDGKLLLSDIIYLINYLFKSGPTPVKSRECCL